MNLDALYSDLTLKTDAKLALVVLDGLGDLATAAQNELTPLEAARTPNLDALVAAGVAQGRMIPVAPGITPGSGPGHLALFGYDPLEFQVGRGVIEALDQAKKEGKVRFVGFTGHKSPAIHLKMLAHDYPFDTVQMPLNCFDATYRSFEQLVLPELARRGIAALGMKSLGGDGQPILHGAVLAEEALRYAMSLPVATTISGIDSLAVLHQNLAIARGFTPMTPEEMEALRRRCASLAADGHLELFKSTKRYDGAVGREQHGYPPSAELPL